MALMSAKPGEVPADGAAEVQQEAVDVEEKDAAAKKGKFVFPDGSRYDGEYDIIDDRVMRHGKGRSQHGPESYEGEWRNDMMHGNGAYAFATGAQYEGEFCNNLLHGDGLYKWPDGASYQGKWRANKMHGFGMYTDKDGVEWKARAYDNIPSLNYVTHSISTIAPHYMHFDGKVD